MPTPILATVPVLRVRASPEAEAFYRDRLGFEVRSAYRPGDGADPAYLVMAHGDGRLHLSSFPGDGEPGASVVNVYVADLDRLYAGLQASGVEVSAPVDQSWGAREMQVADPDGNRLRFVQAA